MGTENLNPADSALFILHPALNWQAASVLPRANGVLETLVRKLARGL